MSKITQLSFMAILLFGIRVFAQENTLIDFSNTNTTAGNWNNVVQTTMSQVGMTVNLINSEGASTGAVLTVTDAFNNVNAAGTTSPDAALPFPSTATADSFFGNDVAFGGATEPTGGIEFTGLEPAKYYSFQVFASRMSVTNNRETKYTITGNNTLSANLDAANNTSNMAKIYNIQPDATGKITLAVQKGTNNNDSYGFYYLGAIQMIKTSLPYSDTTNPTLSLIYPNGGEIWHATATPYISWDAENLSEDVSIQYSLDNGTTWVNLSTVAANIKKYVWTIPYAASNQCKVRITSGTLNDVSENSFSIISNTDKRFKIVVLGSSTAAGAGPSTVNNAWVWMYTDYLKQRDTRFDVTNLAVGGYTTYKILPTGTTVPSGITIDTERNVTKASALNADGIIVNMPSNDSNMLYSADIQMTNYHLVADAATAANIPIWICTVQPRNFGTATAAQNIQNEMVTRIPQEFPDTNIDFWTTLANTDGSVNTLYDSGDGIHLNDAGHLILLDRVINKNPQAYVAMHDNNVIDVVSSTKNYLVDINYNATQYPTSGNWNNLSGYSDGSITGLIDDIGGTSTINVNVTDAFSQSNDLGVLNPSGNNPFPSTAVRDAFYGDNNNPTGIITFGGLNPNKVYTFEIFASRREVTDNCETLFSAIGATTANATLNATTNSANTCLIAYVAPDASGNILLNVSKGLNNDNSNGYYHVNTIKLQESNPIFPDVLLNAEDGTFNRIGTAADNFNVFANGPSTETQAEKDTLMTIIENPDVSGVNTSTKVVQFIRRTTGDDAKSWAGFYTSVVLPKPDFTVNKYVHVKIRKSDTTPQKFKIEGGTTNPNYFELNSTNSYTTPNQWQDIVFHFPNATGTYNIVGLSPDWSDPIVAGADRIIYFDDIIINNNPTPITAGIQDNYLASRIAMFPNPAQNMLYVDTMDELKAVNIFTIEGRQVTAKNNLSVGMNQIDLSNLNAGVYFVKFTATNGATLTQKVIKN